MREALCQFRNSPEGHLLSLLLGVSTDQNKTLVQSIRVRGAVATWLARTIPDWAVRVGALARRDIVVFLDKTPYYHSTSLHPRSISGDLMGSYAELQSIWVHLVLAPKRSLQGFGVFWPSTIISHWNNLYSSSGWKSRANYKFQTNKNRIFRSDFDGTPRGNYIISITTDEARKFPHHSTAKASHIARCII